MGDIKENLIKFLSEARNVEINPQCIELIVNGEKRKIPVNSSFLASVLTDSGEVSCQVCVSLKSVEFGIETPEGEFLRAIKLI